MPEVSFIVTDKAMRPASSKRMCFYCKQLIDRPHKPDCVLITKNVKVRMIVEYNIRVPLSYDKDDIEFQRNEGSWCANNAINELEDIFCREDKACMCSVAKFEYLGGDSDVELSE